MQIEALVPLYQGIRHFRDGDLSSALASFWKAEKMDDKFVEAIEWEARCYDALKLPTFADAVRRYARECLVGRGVSVPSCNIPTDGITFLGIQGEEDSPLKQMKAVDALVSIAPGKIVLPDELAAYRNEYDSIVGGSDKAWLSAPGFLTRWSLRASPKQGEEGNLEWTLFDTLTGTIKSRKTTTPDVKDWNRSLANLSSFSDLSGNGTNEATLPRASSPQSWSLDSVTDDEEKSNLELLRTLAINPADPALIGKKLEGMDRNNQPKKKYFNRKYSLEENFLNYALKETVRKALPANDPYRAWLELDKIASFMKYDPAGLLYSGENMDPIEGLRKFVEAHPDDAPGAFAKYMILIETMDTMDPQERIKACHATVDALAKANVQGTFDESRRLLDCARHLETLSRIAAGETEVISGLPGAPFPLAVAPKITIGDEKIGVQWRLEERKCDEWVKIPVPKDQWKQEAIAAIHIIGGSSHGARIPPAWLDEAPDSLILLSFSEKAVHEVATPFGLPDKSPIDAKADRENYRKTLDYFLRNIPQRLKNVTKGSELMFLAQKTDQFVKHLSYYVYSSEITDQEFFTIQKKLYQDVVAAAEKIGENPVNYTDDYWPEMPRWVSPLIWNAWQNPKAFIGSYEKLSEREISAGSLSFQDSPTQKAEWWSFMSSDHGLSPDKNAEFALRHLGKMNELYHPDDLKLAPLLGEREAAFLFNYGSILFYGRYYKEAVPWFALVSAIPDGPLMSTKQSREIRQNASLYKARCLLREGRLNEALTLASASVATASAQAPPMRYITHVWPSGMGLRFEYDGLLNTVGMRLVRDIRLLSSSKDLPDNLKVFQIPLQGAPGNSDMATFFLRLPSGKIDISGSKMPLLVISPSTNHSGAEYLLDSNEWARFADEYGVGLLVPEFEFGNERPGGASESQQAAFWSGKTLLEAVKWVSDRYPVDPDRLMIHGYGGGATFASGFVRWAPERCSAVSLSSWGNMDTYSDGCIGMKPFCEIKSVPLLVTCGQRDDARFGIFNRRIVAERYAAEAKAAGADVEWKVLPETGHVPTHEMEKTVEDFFVRKAHLTKRSL